MGMVVSQPHHCFLNCLVKCKSKKTSKLHITGLCARNSPVAGEFPAQMASNVENVSIWWRHHVISRALDKIISFLLPTDWILQYYITIADKKYV